MGDPEVSALLRGLRAPQKRISSVYFYDALGSRLFEEITAQPEYYLTRTELPLIRSAARRLVPWLRDREIVELGSGDCTKISLLFEPLANEQLRSLVYRPMDVSVSAVRASAAQLQERYPDLTVDALVTNFITEIHHLPQAERSRLLCFFGSTLGNLNEAEQAAFFDGLGGAMQPGDRLLLGVDMIKDPAVVERAYNDRAGVTARFNRNILNVVNRTAGTDFDPDEFEHLAFYNASQRRIEMHLRAKRDLWVASPLLQRRIQVREGETIHTENSHKFSPQAVEALASRAGLSIEKRHQDRHGWFSLYELRR